MKQITAALLAFLLVAPAFADHRHHGRHYSHNRHNHYEYNEDLAAAAIVLGTIGAVIVATQQQPQTVIVQQPAPVPVQPSYGVREYSPQPRVMTSHEPCYRYGQMVQTYDQFGRPMGFRSCQ